MQEMKNKEERIMKRTILLMAIVSCVSQGLHAQKLAVKTNLLSDAFLNPNAGIEVGVAPRWTLEVDGQLNAWTLNDGKRWKHWAIQPGVRYWLCDRFGGHYFGAHLHGGQFNVGGVSVKASFLGTDFGKVKDTRYQGWFAGAGVSYGYAFVLGRHWNLETELGLGYSYTHYDRFRCTGCQKKIETGRTHHYVGVTKTAVNLVYVF